jgi:CYTH domain-containing protein
LLTGWKTDNIPANVKNESFHETLTYLKTKIVNGQEIRSYLKKRVSSSGHVFLSYTKRQMSETEMHRVELHRKVDKAIFDEFLEQRDETRKEVQRDTTHIIFEDTNYLVESYDNFALLRISTFSEDQDVKIPEWFGKSENVTEVEKYFSYNLSNVNFSA